MTRLEQLAHEYRQLPPCPKGKVQFIRRIDAVMEAKRISATPRKSGPDVPSEAFHCWHCGAWHIGRCRDGKA